MKKTPFNTLFLIVALNVFLITPVFAQDMQVVSRELDMYLKRQRHTFDLGVETYRYKYVEMMDGDKFMNDRGLFYGLFGAYTFRPVDMDSFLDEVLANVYRVELRYASGKVDYTGSGTFEGLKDTAIEARGILGHEYNWGDTCQFMPYAGLGLRYLNDGLQAYAPGGYDRESRYLYIPLGFSIDKGLAGDWGIGLNLEYDLFIQGRQDSHIGDVDPAYDTLTNKQNKGFGARGSVKLEKRFSHMKLSVEPFYRFWHIDDSTVDPITVSGEPTLYGGMEPDNKTQEVGIKMGVQF
jgi:hypothetical protein